VESDKKQSTDLEAYNGALMTIEEIELDNPDYGRRV
jgi:hypothetical protein